MVAVIEFKEEILNQLNNLPLEQLKMLEKDGNYTFTVENGKITDFDISDLDDFNDDLDDFDDDLEATDNFL